MFSKKIIDNKDVVSILLNASNNQTITIEDYGDYIFRCEDKMYYGIYELIELVRSLPCSIELITRDGYDSSDIEAKDQQRRREKVVKNMLHFLDTNLCPDINLSWIQEERKLFYELAKNIFNLKTDVHITAINKLKDKYPYDYFRYKEMLGIYLEDMNRSDFLLYN